jgi:hypothetical protein
MLRQHTPAPHLAVAFLSHELVLPNGPTEGHRPL